MTWLWSPYLHKSGGGGSGETLREELLVLIEWGYFSLFCAFLLQ